MTRLVPRTSSPVLARRLLRHQLRPGSVPLLLAALVLLAGSTLAVHSGEVELASTASVSPSTTGATVLQQADSLSLPPGHQLYLYSFSTGGGLPSTGLTKGSVKSVADAAGNVSVGIAATSSNSNSFATGSAYSAIAGVAVSGFNSYTDRFAESSTPGPTETTAVTVPVHTSGSLIVAIGVASSSQTIAIKGSSHLTVDAISSPHGSALDAEIAQVGEAPPGDYSFTLTSDQSAAGQTPDYAAALLGVFVFTPGEASQVTMPAGPSPARSSPLISPPSLPAFDLASPTGFRASIHTNLSGRIRWTANNLPPGFSLTSAGPGSSSAVLEGNPFTLTASSYSIPLTVTATNALGTSISKQYYVQLAGLQHTLDVSLENGADQTVTCLPLVETQTYVQRILCGYPVLHPLSLNGYALGVICGNAPAAVSAIEFAGGVGEISSLTEAVIFLAKEGVSHVAMTSLVDAFERELGIRSLCSRFDLESIILNLLTSVVTSPHNYMLPTLCSGSLPETASTLTCTTVALPRTGLPAGSLVSLLPEPDSTLPSLPRDETIVGQPFRVTWPGKRPLTSPGVVSCSALTGSGGAVATTADVSLFRDGVWTKMPSKRVGRGLQADIRMPGTYVVLMSSVKNATRSSRAFLILPVTIAGGLLVASAAFARARRRAGRRRAQLE